MRYASLTSMRYASLTSTRYASLTSMRYASLTSMRYASLTSMRYASLTSRRYASLTSIFYVVFSEHHIFVRKCASNQEALKPGYVNRSNSSFCIAFGVVQGFRILILSVLALHVSLTFRLEIAFLCGLLLCK